MDPQIDAEAVAVGLVIAAVAYLMFRVLAWAAVAVAP